MASVSSLQNLEVKNTKKLLFNRNFTDNELSFLSFSQEDNENMVDNKKLKIHWLYFAKCKKPVSLETAYVNTLIIRVSNERIRNINKTIVNKIFKYIAEDNKKSSIYKLHKLQNFDTINSNIILITEQQFINKKTTLFKLNLPDDSFVTNTYVRLFPAEHIRFNILDHILVPKHKVLSKEEIEELCEFYDSPKFIDKLPIMNIHDPVCRYLGGKDGTVYKIIYNDNSIKYRIVRKKYN